MVGYKDGRDRKTVEDAGVDIENKVRRLQNPAGPTRKYHFTTMKVLLGFLALFFLIGVAACHRSTSSAPSMLGSYELTGYNNSGQRVFTGTISLMSIDEKYINGQCSIIRERDAPPTILDQKPRCQALLEEKKITIDLAPYLDDGGMILNGEIGADRISGHWMFKSFAGTQPQGKFEALSDQRWVGSRVSTQLP